MMVTWRVNFSVTIKIHPPWLTKAATDKTLNIAHHHSPFANMPYLRRLKQFLQNDQQKNNQG